VKGTIPVSTLGTLSGNSRVKKTIKRRKKIMRERMVTRTVTQTTAKVMCLNVTTAEVTINEYTIGGTYTEVDLLKKCKKLFETDEFKVLHIESSKVEEILLGMAEEDFIRYATVLPPRKQQGD
jgi:hypothetical protein